MACASKCASKVVSPLFNPHEARTVINLLDPCRIKLIDHILALLRKAPKHRGHLIKGFKTAYHESVPEHVAVSDENNWREAHAIFWLRQEIALIPKVLPRARHTFSARV